MRNADWWRNAVIYQVYPRSFFDSNSDGEGDLPGIISKLPYIKELGVDALWLSPFYRSPNNDGGYDVADPRDVDPRFGSLDDAERLIRESHHLGLRVIFDIVPNHFSTEHPWFQEALRSRPGSAQRNRFHFYDGRGEQGEIPPNNWNSIFGGPAWTRIAEPDGTLGQWYLHLFDSTQADLNWKNPEVAKDFEETLKFWLSRGVDGFRIDVAHGLAKEEILKDHPDPEGLTRALRLDITDMPQDQRESLLSDVPFFDREGVHEIYRSWRKIFEKFGPDRMSVAEAWVHPSSRAVRYVRSDELHQIFNFDFLIASWESRSLIAAIKKTLEEVASVGAPPTWVLCNHDSPRLVTRMGGGESGARKARAFALVTQALPGGVYIYQGEELGLPDGELPDSARQDPVFFRTKGADKGRDGARIPLPWLDCAEDSYGFTSGRPWLPIPHDWNRFAVETQNRDEESSINLYRTSLRIRKNHPALQPSLASDARKDFSWIDAPDGIIAFQRKPGFLLYANTTDNDQGIALVEESLSILLASDQNAHITKNLEGGTSLQLPSHSTVWLQN